MLWFKLHQIRLDSTIHRAWYRKLSTEHFCRITTVVIQIQLMQCSEVLTAPRAASPTFFPVTHSIFGYLRYAYCTTCHNFLLLFEHMTVGSMSCSNCRFSSLLCFHTWRFLIRYGKVFSAQFIYFACPPFGLSFLLLFVFRSFYIVHFCCLRI